MTTRTTTVAIAGGGPAGVMLGLLLARRGVEVVVLEQHADFLRDFRGDTVHPVTQAVLADLGLADELAAVARGRMSSVEFATTDGVLVQQDLAAVAPHDAAAADIAVVPQWDLLDLLVRAARRCPSFRLEMESEVVGALRDERAVRGLRHRSGGEEHELRAVLTVAADGRRSVLRPELRTAVRRLGSAVDVLWFRLERRDGDRRGLRGVIGRGGGLVAVDRGDSWQVALLVAAGEDPRIRAAGLPALRDRVGAMAPWMRERLGGVTDWEAVKTLSVRVERLRRWAAPGLLAIGDAAHTMSPVGGVGVELAVADAVAAADVLGPALLRAQDDPDRFDRVLDPALLHRVQRRRLLVTAVTQRVQVLAQERVLAVGRAAPGVRLMPSPVVLALLRGPVARLLPRLLVFGVRPQRVRD